MWTKNVLTQNCIYQKKVDEEYSKRKNGKTKNVSVMDENQCRRRNVQTKKSVDERMKERKIDNTK